MGPQVRGDSFIKSDLFRTSIDGLTGNCAKTDVKVRNKKVEILNSFWALEFGETILLKVTFSGPRQTDRHTDRLAELIYKTSGCPWPKAIVKSPVGARDLWPV